MFIMSRKEDNARKQLDEAKEMLGISDERADEIFNDETNHKQKKREELKQE